MEKKFQNGYAADAASDYSKTVPLVGVDMNVSMDGWASTGVNTPVWDTPASTMQDSGDTIPMNPVPDNWADTADYKTAGVKTNDDYNVTLPLNRASQNSAIRPVTGWLVCIDGVEKGKDYRLHGDINYIGRSKNNDVVLGSDPTVSRERHAMIAYDDRSKAFFFAPAGGASLIRQNGRPVLSTVELKAGDRLEVGEGTYLFMPLCGEDFQW